MYQTTLAAFAVLALGLIARFLQKWWYQRNVLNGLPQPPHSMIFGHLRLFGEMVARMPPVMAAQNLVEHLREYYDLPPVYYLDMWPVMPPFMIVSDPDVHEQVASRELSLEKHYLARKFLKHIAGEYTNLVGAEGASWKRRRTVFNPAFSAKALMGMVPNIVPVIDEFRQIMIKKAEKNELFRLDKPCTRVTIDVIGRFVLDHDFNSQHTENPLIAAFESQASWLEVGFLQRPSELWDIRRPYMFWKNTRTMNNYIRNVLQERYKTTTSRPKQKYIIDLALESYLKEQHNGMTIEEMRKLPEEFVRDSIDEVKIFIFAGHDTTSSTIAISWYELAKKPETLAKIRAEHDAVFGPDESTAGEQIKNDPTILNKLEYTAAVIKEVLRLHPPASSVRTGKSSASLYNPSTGERYPMTDDMMIFNTAPSLHRNLKHWGPTANTFIPERWLPNPPSELKPPQNAYHPFSQGPRNCIGQELANIEAKLILAMTVRLFDVHAAYDEVGKLRGDGSGWLSLEKPGLVYGDPMYSYQMGTAKPSEGLPVRLTLRK